MKKAISITFLLLIGFCTMAQSKGDTLYVATHSGLNLRTEPGTKAAKITAIPKEGMVIILADVDSSQAFAVSEFPGFQIKGFWVEVAYKGQAGYVFSGYLSGFKPNLISNKIREFYYLEPDYIYLTQYVDSISNKEELKYTDYCDTCLCGWTQGFKKGISYNLWSSCEEAKGLGTKIIFNHLELQDVYLFYLSVYNPSDGGIDTTFFNPQKKMIESRPAEGKAGCYFELYMEGKNAVLKYHCGC